MGDGEADSTLQLIEAARDGSQPALDRLMARHLAPLRRWARGRLPPWARDTSDTDDIVQDVLLQSIRHLDGFDVRGRGAFQAYLREGILNRVRDAIRKAGRRPPRDALDGLEPDRGRSPLELAIGREALDRYERALSSLAHDDQEAIIGRIEMGYSYEELAGVLGRPTAEAARKAAQRALVRLVRRMNEPDAV